MKPVRRGRTLRSNSWENAATRLWSLGGPGVRLCHKGVRLKGSDYSFTQPLRIAFSAFRDLDYVFGDEKGHRRLAVSHLQPLKGHFVRGN
jgi:hypothetical protein